jgi:hypothetical protein
MSHRLCLGVIFAGIIFSTCSAHAQKAVEIRAVWSVDPCAAKPDDQIFVVIKPYLKESNSIYRGKLFRADDPRLTKENFSFKTKAGKDVDFTVVPPDESPGFLIKLVPKKTPSKDQGYTLTIKEPFNLVTTTDVSVGTYAGKSITLSEGDLGRNLDYNKATPTNKVSVVQGKASAFSLEATYIYPLTHKAAKPCEGSAASDSKGGSWIDPDSLLRFNLKGDSSFQSVSSRDYLDKLEAEIGGYLAGYFHNYSSIGELGVKSTLQSDRNFDTVDQAIGVNGFITVTNTFTTAVSHLFVSRKSNPDDPHGQDYELPPILSLGYDYVVHLTRDKGVTRTDVSQNRLVGRLYWEIPILRGLQLPSAILKDPNKRIDADFIADLGATYDLAKSKFLPETKLNLDLYWSKLNEAPQEHSKRAAITLTFVNGQSAPKFENYNAILGGIKLPF